MLLFGYLILMTARQRGRTWHVLRHAVLSLSVVYLVLAGYIVVNATQNHFVGMIDAQNINLWGKVLQYHMQNEATPKYAAVTQIANTYVPNSEPTPEEMLWQHAMLSRNHYALAAEYARFIIERHPVEFLAKSVPLALSSLLKSFSYESRVAPRGSFGGLLLWITAFYRFLYRLNIVYPVCAGIWLFLLFWRRTAGRRHVQAMGALVVISLYGLALTTVGGIDSYIRLHTPFYPLLILTVWGSLLVALDDVRRSRDLSKVAARWRSARTLHSARLIGQTILCALHACRQHSATISRSPYTTTTAAAATGTSMTVPMDGGGDGDGDGDSRPSPSR